MYIIFINAWQYTRTAMSWQNPNEDGQKRNFDQNISLYHKLSAKVVQNS